MRHAAEMPSDNATTFPVIDFRRHSMVLQWHALGGTWTACDSPPSLVHGVALIRASRPNICVYGQGGRLRLQVGPHQYGLAENSPRISCVRGLASFGFRRRFSVESSTGGMLFSYAYWTTQHHDFFSLAGDKGRRSRLAGNERSTVVGRHHSRGAEVQLAARTLQRGNSPAISVSVRLRHCPELIPPRRMFMIRTRCRRRALYPSAEHMRRIWRFRPCVRIMRNDC